jgi:2'-5' RNA ligase
MKRTFIAVRIDPGEELRNAVSSLRSGLRKENIRWVDISNMHVTLAFIGDTDGPMVKRIGSMLKDDFAGYGNIDFRLTGFGVFRNFNDPRIIFTGIDNRDRLAGAHEIVKKSLERLYIKLEDRQFKPHLTIGRIKDLRDKNSLQNLIQKYVGIKLQDVTVSEIVYYESVLLPTGPLYKPISTIMLN